ncbi:unnamed protein product [Paramecium sonneborni]|uniref:H-type lectin domain-containing protein n=1 Tax=Paramecium sonneborni TaxID=65129 RepID=A0A8S1PQ40_9CILI|nr:unnamed protein product [Paramecium sonneborni]
MKLLAVFSLLIEVFNLRIPQFDSGNAVGVSHSQGHILETQTYVPRQVVVYVQFSVAFETIPQVFISQSKVDSYDGSIGFNQRVGLITQKGFLVHSIALTSQSLIQLYFYWIAMCDDGVQVITFDTYDVKSLRTITGQREVLFQIDHNFQEATRGLISLNGFHFSNQLIQQLNSRLQKLPRKKQQYLGHLMRNHYQIIQVLVFFLALIYHYGLHLFILLQIFQQIISQIFKLTFQVIILAMNQFLLSHGEAINMVNECCFEYQNNIYILDMGDSVVYAIFHSAAIYVFDANHKIFDENCLELFSQCDFSGESILVCEKIPNLSIKGWSKPVKSLTIPKQKTINLFTKENY